MHSTKFVEKGSSLMVYHDGVYWGVIVRSNAMWNFWREFSPGDARVRHFLTLREAMDAADQ